ncbi:MAG: 3-hydroxyacyl-ACP dehydratase [Ferruginibacter sp.]|nr:3-hydroxyacyl-ACP dehydratase [Ferruginibacter sp.]
MQLENIVSYIPQRYPFVMVDKIISSNDTTTNTSFRVNADNIFVENGYLKEPALIENIAQSAAARAGFTAKENNEPVMVGYIGAIKNTKIFALPQIGDTLFTEIIIENNIFDVSIISGKITCNDSLIAQCQMKIFINKT